jgi:hypothetical protein
MGQTRCKLEKEGNNYAGMIYTEYDEAQSQNINLNQNWF